MIEDDHSIMGGGVMIRVHGGFELLVGKLISCCGFLLTCSVISLIIVPLGMGYCILHSIYLSLSDCVSLIR